MTRTTTLSSPLLVGFEAIEKSLERVAKSGDGYPPYNIERIAAEDRAIVRITLAVAGFGIDDLEITTEDSQLIIRGQRAEEDQPDRQYLHRGIAARQFQRAFVLADGMRVIGAQLENGLLMIDLDRPQPERQVRRIAISQKD
ncbi:MULTISPECIES: Hsp20 family protein [unclassified Roseitalea]|uniref:Hsp20 family protein n=1 Tax=unclassified Roseitalea TaxID=2639107 RepID=UPI00273D6B10|nr:MULTISPECIES: Hsp20 family protein [unclassified Roseitalea]